MGGPVAQAKGRAMKPALQQRLPLVTAAGIFMLLFVAAGLKYHGFFTLRVFLNLFIDQAVLGIVAVGLTMVIFSGGIDLSVGAVVGFVSIFMADQVMNHQVAPWLAAAEALALGAAFGTVMGVIIQVFKQPPFLITLAGMFLARGCAFWISTEATPISDPLYDRLSLYELALGKNAGLTTSALALLAVLAAGYVLAHHTRFGRNVLAIGGSEQSALLMGLPVGWTKIGVYALSGCCAAFAGVVNTVGMGSGNPAFGIGLELDAIAVVVIGGTLLAGGRGHMLGTLCGLLVLGTINSAINFDGSLSPAWGRIVVGLLLLGFILLQRLFLRGPRRA
jgi:simple sugar transport system permease protein